MELRRDYFIHSEGEMTFFDNPSCECMDIYSQKAERERFAKSSGRLERADQKDERRLRQGEK